VEEEKKDIKMDLIPTTEFIKKLNVIYDEVLDSSVEEEDFIITPIAPFKAEQPKEIFEEDEQITLTFDLPLFNQNFEETPKNEKRVLFDLDETTKNINVNDHIEIIPVTQADEKGEKRYALDDFSTFESSLNKTKTKQKPEIEEDIVFEKKVISTKEETYTPGEVDPLNSPISDMLKERADERRRKMKDFNYKFSSAKIDEIEKEPAYKRQGVNLEEKRYSSDINASRMSVGTDDNDDVQLRSNNSFLHDNVD
jgi:cell division protein FtsZ